MDYQNQGFTCLSINKNKSPSSFFTLVIRAHSCVDIGHIDHNTYILCSILQLQFFRSYIQRVLPKFVYCLSKVLKLLCSNLNISKQNENNKIERVSKVVIGP